MIYDDKILPFTRLRSKDREKAVIFRIIDESKIVSKRQLVEMGFRPNSVTNIINELLEDRLLLTCAIEPGRKRGRPEIFYSINYNRAVCISLYIEGRELKAALINLAHDILYESSLHMNTDVGNAEFLSHLFELITCVSNSAKAEKIIGIGIAVPGTVQPSEKIWLSALRFPKIQNLNFMGIQKKLKLPVQVYKDTHSILQYQILMNPSYKTGSTILFKWDFAIGFGYANNSIILDSAYGRYGSIGHAFIINPFGKKCICGKRGCLETETGTWALLPQLKKDYPSLNHDERSFSKVFRHKDIKNIHPIQNALKHIKTCLYSICYFFYPDRILFVGPFTENEEIFANIENFIKKSMITEDYAQRIKLQVIENAYHGCFHSSAHNLFNAALEPFLRVRY